LSYDEMTEELKKWLDPETNNEADGTTTTTRSSSLNNSAKTVTTTDDIADAFGELFNT